MTWRSSVSILADFGRMVNASSISDVYHHTSHGRFSCLHNRKLVRKQFCIILLVGFGYCFASASLLTMNRDIGLVVAAYTFWKLFKKTKIVSLTDINLREAIERAQQDPGMEEIIPRWRKFVGFLWD